MQSVPELWHIRTHLRLAVNTVNGCFYQSVIAFFFYWWHSNERAAWKWISLLPDGVASTATIIDGMCTIRAISANRSYTLPHCIFSSRHGVKIKLNGSLPFWLRSYDGLVGEGAGAVPVRVSRDYGLSNVTITYLGLMPLLCQLDTRERGSWGVRCAHVHLQIPINHNS
jgi:hypothetical protein